MFLIDRGIITTSGVAMRKSLLQIKVTFMSAKN